MEVAQAAHHAIIYGTKEDAYTHHIWQDCNNTNDESNMHKATHHMAQLGTTVVFKCSHRLVYPNTIPQC